MAKKLIFDMTYPPDTVFVHNYALARHRLCNYLWLQLKYDTPYTGEYTDWLCKEKGIHTNLKEGMLHKKALRVKNILRFVAAFKSRKQQ